MNENDRLKLLFIVNRNSGSNDTDWHKVINEYFSPKQHTVEIFELPDSCNPKDIQSKIDSAKPDRVIAIGGDGTVKLVAQCLLHTELPLGIVPGGSANGMAKELNIPNDPKKALDIATTGDTKKIHLIKVNDELCIHLSDIGFNAFVVKKFENESTRGMWGYMKATWKVFWNRPIMTVEIDTDNEMVRKQASMIVIANATKYGTGALINPDGKLDDGCFEIIVIKKLSFKEIFKMVVTHMPYDPAKTEVFQTTSLTMKSKRKAHFQVDGEYLGRINTIHASIIPQAIRVIVPTS